VLHASALIMNLNTNVTMEVTRRQAERFVGKRCEFSDGGISCRGMTLTCSSSDTIDVEEDVTLDLACDAD
jgi:hypothetical protein